MSTLRRGFVASAAFAALALACGGSSEDTDIHDDETGGSSGSGNGGTGASQGGSGAQGGSSGSSSGKGGSAGSAAGSGGSPATGGSGGASGSAGMEGTGAMRGYHPPDRHLQGCRALCEKEASAMCSNETTFEKCVEDCHAGILLEPCADVWDPVHECVVATETVGCSASGGAVMPDCIPPYIEYLDCQSTAITAGPLGPECNEHCASAAAADCPNGGTLDECVSSCRLIAATFPVCATTYAAFLTCSAAAEQTCDADGEPEPTGCAGTLGTFIDCLSTDYAWRPGIGIAR